ncbi:MAG: hypothetical protein LUG83_00010 [Lachnospiraceae bacterium]|nr:hypothetical protein [Lachnospiraceae bacterium]
MEELSARSLQKFVNNATVEYFKDIPQTCRLTDNCTSVAFIEELCRKYHYPDAEKAALREVALNMKKSILSEAALSYAMTNLDGNIPAACVVITLGEGIDRIQEEYMAAFMLSECYMAEVIAGELLLRSYPVCNERLGRLSGMKVARYLFPGSTPRHDVSELPDMLAGSGLRVKCNEAFCILPMKSVAFYAILTADENTVCEGICVGCGRTDCPNRVGEDGRLDRVSDFVGAAFNYGYARIFGRKYI